MSKADDLLNTPYTPGVDPAGPTAQDWRTIYDQQRKDDPMFGAKAPVMDSSGQPLFPDTPEAMGAGFSDRRDFGYDNFSPNASGINRGFQGMGDAAANRPAPVLQRTTGDWGGNGPTAGQFSNPAYQNQMQTRGQQGDYINSLQNDVNGGTPSLAQLQLKQGADMALQNQAAMAASGGPTNYAFAQRNAAQQGASTMQNLNAQQGMLRAQEHTAAQAQLGNALNQQRVADLQATGMSYQNAIQQAQLEAGQNQNQANLEAQQRGLNQQGQFGWYGMGQHVMDQDLASRMHYRDLMASKYANDRNLQAQSSQFQTAEDNRQSAADDQRIAGAIQPLASAFKQGGG